MAIQVWSVIDHHRLWRMAGIVASTLRRKAFHRGGTRSSEQSKAAMAAAAAAAAAVTTDAAAGNAASVCSPSASRRSSRSSSFTAARRPSDCDDRFVATSQTSQVLQSGAKNEHAPSLAQINAISFWELPCNLFESTSEIGVARFFAPLCISWSSNSSAVAKTAWSCLSKMTTNLTQNHTNIS